MCNKWLGSNLEDWEGLQGGPSWSDLWSVAVALWWLLLELFNSCFDAPDATFRKGLVLRVYLVTNVKRGGLTWEVVWTIFYDIASHILCFFGTDADTRIGRNDAPAIDDNFYVAKNLKKRRVTELFPAGASGATVCAHDDETVHQLG